MSHFRDNMIVFHTSYKIITKSNSAAILLSVLVNLHSRFGGKVFYRTDVQIMRDSALTPNELKGAKELLKKLYLIEVTLKHTKLTKRPITHYRLDLSMLSKLLDPVFRDEPIEEEDGGENHQMPIGENQQMGPFGENHQLNHDNHIHDHEYENKIKEVGGRDKMRARDALLPPPDFDLFWKAYPGDKIGKKKAKEAWDKHQPPIDVVLKALQMLQETRKLQTDAKVAPHFLKHPTTWLNGHCWNDEISIEETQKRIKEIKRTEKKRFESMTDDDMEDVKALNQRIWR